MALHRVPSLGQYAWQPPVLATQASPPASPAKGDRYIVASSPTGAWTGYATYIATYDGNAWIFDQPSEGWRAYDISADGDKLFNGTSWQAAGGGGLGYALKIGPCNAFNPNDGATYYFGSYLVAPITSSEYYMVINIPKAGTIKAVTVEWYIAGTPGDDSSFVTFYLRKTGSGDTQIGQETMDSTWSRVLNTSLSIAVSAGNTVVIKMVCPTWTTNPTNVYLSGHIYIE